MKIEEQTKIKGIAIGEKVYDSFNKRNGVVQRFYETCYHDIGVYLRYGEDDDEVDTGVLLSGCRKLEAADIERQKEEARSVNALVDHLTKLIESDDKRYSFVFASGGAMEIYDKEAKAGYAVHIAPIEYDKDGNVTNL